MAKRKLEERLEQLRRLRDSTFSEDFDATLRAALRERSNLVVAEAAKIAGARNRAAMVSELLAALERLYVDPVKVDSKCWGKTAIVKALAALDYSQSEPFQKAAQHIQLEPVYGGQEDAAIHLRANAVLALVQCDDLSRAQILRHLVDALADPGDPVRIEAVRALEQMNGEEGTLLLRLKAHAGDPRPHVLGQVFDSLVGLEGPQAITFIAGFLNAADGAVCDEAALSIGSSRLPSAVKILVETWENTTRRELRPVLLRALSASRDENALEFLLHLVKDGASRDSAAALDALQLHSDSPDIQERVEGAKLARESRGR